MRIVGTSLDLSRDGVGDLENPVSSAGRPHEINIPLGMWEVKKRQGGCFPYGLTKLALTNFEGEGGSKNLAMTVQNSVYIETIGW